MKNICLLLAAACLFSVTTFAHDNIHVTGKADSRMLDAIGPAISFTLLTQSSCVPTRSFTATITDIDGVNTSFGTRPRVYYKRTTDADTYAGNTSADNGWKYTEATNTSSPFSFDIDYSIIWGGSVTSGQTIQYFVVAQDLVAIPNVGSGGTTFSTPPSSVALTAASFPAGGSISIYNIVNALPTYITVGPSIGADFTNFSGAGGLFSTINGIGLSGNTIVEIIDPLVTENNANFLYPIQNTGCSAGTVTLLIKPASGVTATVTGNVAAKPILTILSSNVTIDGSNNGTTSRDLTLRNTNTGGSNVIIIGSSGVVPINNSTLKNTICTNGSNTLSAGTVVLCDVATGSTGYFNNITIQNNSIRNGTIGVLCSAVSTAGNGTNILITANDINSSAGVLGIYTEGVDGAVISNNNIGNFNTTLASTRYGIWLSTNTKNTTVSGNNISGISYTGGITLVVYGIRVASNATTSNINITGNVITGITSNSTGVGSAVYGINVTSEASGGITIQKNNISNIKQTNVTGYAAHGIGINSSLSNANIIVSNNFIYDVAGYGSGTTPTVRNGFGIYLSGGGGYNLYHNSVNLNTDQNNTTGISAALMINGVTNASSLDIRNNIFVNSQTSGVPIAARYGIYSANANTIFSSIDNNDYTAAGTNIGFLGSNCANLAAIITAFGSNANSISSYPNFVSSTDLHLDPNAASCPIDNKGTFIASVTDDIDAQIRNTSTPDIGADEFTALSGSLAGIAGSGICSNKPVVSTGTIYTQAATCNLIAKVVPSGTNAVTGNINTCVTLNATQQYFNGEPYVKRHYDIEPAITDQTTTSATVTLYFTDAEFLNYNSLNPAWPPMPTSAGGGNIDPNRANVKITQFHGVAGTSPSTPGNYPGVRVLITPGATNVFWNGSYWEVTFNVTGFSGFYVHSNYTNLPLPVVINYFTGKKQGSDHLLNWKVTCNSTPRVTMTLERSADSRNFTGINSITADAVRCNQPFDYTDTDPLKGMNYYRLKMTDADGKVSYSSIVALLNAVKGFELMSIAPNPVVDDNFKLNVASAQTGKMDIAIFDMQGRFMSRQTISVITGFNSLPVNITNLARGTYSIRVSMADETSKLLRFVKQ